MLTYKEKMYDMYVTSGGSDQCFQNGMNGNCGWECSVFGSKEECFDRLTDEDLVEAYHDGIAENEILSYFDTQEKLHLLRIKE